MTETTLVRQLPADLQLEAGGHAESKHAFCFMEAVAFMAGENWSDAPDCTSPIIRRVGISLNDRWSDADRQLLVPYIPKVIGTTGTREQEVMRKYLAIDWAYRIGVPRSLRFAKMDELALRLESLPQITNEAEYRNARSVMNDIRTATAERREAARASIRERIKAALSTPVAAVAAVVAEVAEVAAAVAAAEVAVAEVAVAEVAVAEAEVVAVAVAVAVVAVAVAVAVVAEVAEAVVAVAVAEAAEAVAAEVAVAEAVEVEVAVAEAVEVAEISRALAAQGGSGSWAQPITKIIAEILPTFPKGADFWAIRSAIYFPVRTEVRRMILAGEFGGEAYRAHRASMRDAVLELLDQLIAVTA